MRRTAKPLHAPTCLALAAAGLLAACSFAPATYNKEPLQGAPAPQPQALRWKDSDKPGDFVALALSGGGAKASVFSGETMFYLDALGLLKKTDMVSSVSGGSFAAAYYALSCEPGAPDCAIAGHQQWRRPLWDYRTTMPVLQSGFKPMVWRAVASFFTPFVKTPVWPKTFAGFIDDHYLRQNGAVADAPFTFGDLNRDHRPWLVLNSTLLSDFRPLTESNKGRGYLRRRTADEYFHFAYTDYYFSQIDSRLDSFPLGYGVASSAAFPALIGYAALSNPRYCRENHKGDEAGYQACLDDDTRMLTLTDGGANDNQGLIEIFTTVAEIADHQQRSNCTVAAPNRPSCEPPLPRMGFDDRGLVLVVNTSLTESTGVGSPVDKDFALGTIDRALAAVDVYSAVGYNLRKRLYAEDLELLCEGHNKEYLDALRGKSAKALNVEPEQVILTPEEKCLPTDTALLRKARKAGMLALSFREIGLVTLDRYPSGGFEASLAQGTGVDDWLAKEMTLSRKRQEPAYDSIKLRRDDFALTPIRPQCLFEQSKLAEQDIFSLAEQDPQNAACLRHAARWATVLRSEELCEAGHVLNDKDALHCEGGHLKGLTQEWKDRFVPLLQEPDEGKQCNFGNDSPEQLQAILTSLRNNDTFKQEVNAVNVWNRAGESDLAALRRMCGVPPATAASR